MELVLGTHHLLNLGGGETYLLTVAEHLQRLGHGVTLHAAEQGEMVDVIRRRGVRVAGSEEELPDRCDAVLVQASTAACTLADRYPHAPQVFVCHSEVFSIDTPPQLPGVVSVLAALSDRVARHLRALALELPVVRLRQPVDVWRFTPLRPPAPRARSVAVITNYLHGRRRELIVEACGELGLECRLFGAGATMTETPELAMGEADIVVGKGRVAVEAMACGRAVYVYDWTGGDGWVTPRSYPALEADAFAGLADGKPVERGRLVSELAAYDADMGVANRDLAVAHHSIEDHAEQLVEIMHDLAPDRERANDCLQEVGRLSREQWRAEANTHGLRFEVAREHERAESLERMAKDALAALEDFKQTRRYRMAQALGRPLDALRGREGG